MLHLRESLAVVVELMEAYLYLAHLRLLSTNLVVD